MEIFVPDKTAICRPTDPIESERKHVIRVWAANGRIYVLNEATGRYKSMSAKEAKLRFEKLKPLYISSTDDRRYNVFAKNFREFLSKLGDAIRDAELQQKDINKKLKQAIRLEHSKG